MPQIDNEEYGEALSLAHAYNLDSDLVYQRQWRKSTVSIASIQDYLVRDSEDMRDDGCEEMSKGGGAKERQNEQRSVSALVFISIQLGASQPPYSISRIIFTDS